MVPTIGVPLSEHDKLRFVEQINALKKQVAEKPGFIDNEELRGLYVSLLTVEGAIMFDDLVDLGLACAEFCQRKERDFIELN
jgi:hypothetical protein